MLARGFPYVGQPALKNVARELLFSLCRVFDQLILTAHSFFLLPAQISELQYAQRHRFCAVASGSHCRLRDDALAHCHGLHVDLCVASRRVLRAVARVAQRELRDDDRAH